MRVVRIMNKPSFAILIGLMSLLVSSVSLAVENSNAISGKYYELDKKDKYTYSESGSLITADNSNAFGSFLITGNYSAASESKNGYPFYKVLDDTLSLTYSFDSSQLSKDEETWHIIEDKTREVDALTLDSDVKMGAAIVQSSLDGIAWQTDVVKTNVFTVDSVLKEPLYTTKPIQQQNGCFYRVIIVYKLQKKTGSHDVAFINVDDFSTKRIAEVYEFYVEDSSIATATSANDTPRTELGKKVKTELNKGYYTEKDESPDKDDPHYGWDLGAFFINGYTRETLSDDHAPVFLKNVGDKVTLWFTLQQDINSLNGNPSLSIAIDKDGYNREFEVSQTNFGQGALLIRFTNHEGVTQKPITIYTNYLAANARTGADTRVQLFEEGDYEVALNYKIMNNPRQIGSVSIVPSYTDYKISFSFSIRNGNCMVYPFDLQTGSELADRAVTPNGFKLDMAKSRYLTIDVKRSVLREGSDGSVVEDVRYSRPAKDGESYTEEGIYTFTVKNLYTDESIAKTMFVGNNKYLLALSKSGMTVVGLNEAIENGTIVQDDGSLFIPTSETPAPTPEPSPTPTVAPTAQQAEDAIAVSGSETANPSVETSSAENHNAYVIIPIVIAGIILTAAVSFILKRKKQHKSEREGDSE